MGCQKSKCKKCGKIIKGRDSLSLSFNQGFHEKEKHPEIHEQNRKAHETFSKDYKIINDKLIKAENYIFTASKWDGEDDAS